MAPSPRMNEAGDSPVALELLPATTAKLSSPSSPQLRQRRLRARTRSPTYRSLRMKARVAFSCVSLVALLALGVWTNHPAELYEAELEQQQLSSGRGEDLSGSGSGGSLSSVHEDQSWSFESLLVDFSVFDTLDGPGCAAESTMKQYGLFLWIFLGIYLFIGIALVCDEYFEESLTCISERLNLSEDVAGATFMAAGSSAPELFVAVIGIIFYPAENPGAGTIIGSAAFNMCIIVALSCILASAPLKLTQWAIYRDSVWYLVSLGFLLLFQGTVTPGRADWWESLIMLLLYVVYCVQMSYNHRIKMWVEKHFDLSLEMKQHVSKAQALESNEVTEDARRLNNDGIALDSKVKTVDTDLDSASVIDVAEKDGDVASHSRSTTSNNSDDSSSVAKAADTTAATTESAGNESSDEDEERTIGGMIWTVLTYPYAFMFKWTIPNCEEDSPRREWFWVTFGMSIVWLGILSFFMVDTFTKISCCVGIPAHFTGLTLIALGTSIPDATASVVVARDGFGDMAVSNAVGSNLMNILCGLPFSWLLGSIAAGGDPVDLSDSGKLWVFIVALVVVVGAYLVCIIFNKFVISNGTGWSLVATYVAFLVFVILYELFVSNTDTSGGCGA